VDVEHDRRLVIETGRDGRVRIGDLEYEHAGELLDLGLLLRQPALWLGNAALAGFFPVKDGWDTPLGGFTPHIYLTEHEADDFSVDLPLLQDGRLQRLHALCCRAMLRRGKTSMKAVHALEQALDLADHRTSEALRRRLEALSLHPEEVVRCDAYRILLLDEPAPDYGLVQPKFIRSGLPFLNEQSISAIARGGMEGRRLQAFRIRLHTYRQSLDWPADEITRTQFNLIFSILKDFAFFDPTYYGAVRDELISWCQHWDDMEIARQAEQHVNDLADWFEKRLDEEIPYRGPKTWENKLVFQEGLSEDEIARLRSVFIGTTFLQQSVMLTSEGEFLDIRDVPRDGIWVGRTAVRHNQRSYRVSINTNKGMHYDLLVVIWDPDSVDLSQDNILSTIYWMVSLAGYPLATPVLPRFGCFRPSAGLMSQAFVSDLNVWERIREYASDRHQHKGASDKRNWRRMYVRSMSAFFRAWRHSGKRIVPGMITPMNVYVPEPDFRAGDQVLSMSGWRRYENTLDLARPMLRNFYKQTIINYPWTEKHLDLTWLCDACVEACGREEATEFLQQLQSDLSDEPLHGYRGRLANELSAYINHLQTGHFYSCVLNGAIQRYRNWRGEQKGASAVARRQMIEEVYRLYGLQRRPEADRYHLYRHTWFDQAPTRVTGAFDTLLAAMFANPQVNASGMVELSDLQSVLQDDEDRRTFMKMVFPHTEALDTTVLLEVGDKEHRQIIVDSMITDKRGTHYHVREPLEPAEHGRLYRHFVKSGYYKTISERDRFFVVSDDNGDIVAGISWQDIGDRVAHLNGIVVAHSLLGRGISSVLIEDFCTRLANLNFNVVKTHFVLRPFFERHGFQVDKRWGGLVRMLEI
jgi:long-chain acyl-CoA synthetase